MTNQQNARRRRLTRNGVTIKQHEDGSTFIVMRRYNKGAVSLTVALSADEVAERICTVFDQCEGRSRGEKVKAVSEILQEFKI